RGSRRRVQYRLGASIAIRKQWRARAWRPLGRPQVSKSACAAAPDVGYADVRSARPGWRRLMFRMLRPARPSVAPSAFVVPRAALGAALALSLALMCAACESGHGLGPDQPPTVTLTSGPVDTVSAPQSWLVDISWTGSDPDGRIDHFEYAIDPPSLKQA